ncbi:MAG TPA: gamma-glutamyltransferase [Bacteroidales bacterium]|nr:gamma-glutamyltransferase [Bacteroidales bacterium]
MKSGLISRALLLTLLALLSGCIMKKDPKLISGRGINTKNGMVVSAHPEASLIGARILLEGGNAFDAAVATGFALAVCYPTAGNIGGGGFFVLRKGDGSTDALDYREKAPMAAHKDIYLDENGAVIKGLSTSSGLASGVPGTVAGALALHKKYGRLSFRRVIQPAIDLASNGYPVTESQASSFNRMRKVFIERNDHPIPFVKDSTWTEGDLLVQPDLAYTLELIRDMGIGGFYAGETADRIVKEMKKSNGLITNEDLMDYETKWRTPITSYYRDYKIIAMPPPASGGVALIQLLSILENYPDANLEFHSPETVHLMVEAERRVYADRAEYLGDPDFVDIPVEALIDKGYLLERMKDFSFEYKTDSKMITAGTPLLFESEETTHYSVVDSEGNAVAATTTLNSGYGSCIMVEGAGFFLNNQMDDFSVKPGYPNIYGLIGGYANSIQPGKRMLSSMTPTIIEKEGELYMIVGTPGGSTIITSVFQTILNVIEFGMDMQFAVDAGRFHHQWLPDNISVEQGAFDSLLIKSLESLGHQLIERSSIGRVDAIRVLPDGSYEAGADSRGDDIAVGY